MELSIVTGLYYDSKCYIIKDNDNAIIVDPCATINDIKKEVEGLNVLGIFLTHGHFDHVISLIDCIKEFNCKVYCNINAPDVMSTQDKNGSKDAEDKLDIVLDDDCYEFLNDDNNIKLENFVIKTLYTPGHSYDAICIIVGDMMFTGDTLFNKGIGRTDLYTGSASQLRFSLRKLHSLDKDYTIYPGHASSSTLKVELSRFFK